MKWMLIVRVFGSHPLDTGLLSNSLDECMKAEAAVHGELYRVSAAQAKEYQERPSSKELAEKQQSLGPAFRMRNNDARWKFPWERPRFKA